MVKYKVEIDVKKCIGCGACASQCPDNFELVETDGEVKARVKKSKVNEIGCNKEAVDICPVQCIAITESD